MEQLGKGFLLVLVRAHISARDAEDHFCSMCSIRKVLAFKQVLSPELPKVAAGEPSLAAHLYTSALNNSAKERFFGAI